MRALAPEPWAQAPAPWWAWVRKSTADTTATVVGPDSARPSAWVRESARAPSSSTTCLKHEKHIILVQGTTMTFVISRSVDASTGKPMDPTAPPAQPVSGSLDR